MADNKPFYCSFAARWLRPAMPIIHYNREMWPDRFRTGHIVIEPAAIGGVYLSVISGHATAVVHDPDGSATGPAKLLIPDETIAAALPVDEIPFVTGGHEISYPMPEWMQAHTVSCTEKGIAIFPKTAPPKYHGESTWNGFDLPALHHRLSFDARGRADAVDGLDYAVNPGKPQMAWQTVMRNFLNSEAMRKPVSEFALNPEIPHLLQGFIDEIIGREPNAGRTLQTAGYGNIPNILRIENYPHFIGFFMHQTWKGDPPPVPDHFKIAAIADEKPETGRRLH
ncbi:hypothetical protein [Martelella mangrovi]|uniref:DUF4336 domain-containing protein n=1 Tax=Martelella mangrovi TaxID=1397477 RepID=A0ABV2IGY7_9HYPH